MAPDADKHRQAEAAVQDCILENDPNGFDSNTLEIQPETNPREDVECVLQRRVMTEFPHIEQPVTCYLTCQGKKLTCNGTSAWFMANDGQTGADEFALLPQADDESMVLQNTKTRQYLCSNGCGGVYASRTRREDSMDRWMMTSSKSGFHITSLVTHRHLACSGSCGRVDTIEDHKEVGTLWTVDLLSGELCFLSSASMDMQVRCDLGGNLSLSSNFQGWEAWRLSEAGNGKVRISPWAHRKKLLSSDEQGIVCTTEERGSSELWSVEKAPNGLHGVVLKSASSGRILRYHQEEDKFDTIAGNALDVDGSCAWDLNSIHKQTYYIVTNNSGRKLKAAEKKNGGLSTRGLPVRLSSEEWIIKTIPKEHGVVKLFSNSCQRYLASKADGEVFLLAEDTVANNDDGSERWAIQEHDQSFVILSHVTQRVLVAAGDKGSSIRTVESGTMMSGTSSTRWNLEPKLPRQVNKEKMQSVGAAVAIGVAGTLATPLLIGGAIGALGIVHVGLAGEIAIGSIKAAEALSTITRLTLSSSQLVFSQSSLLHVSEDSSLERNSTKNRPFCSWRLW